MSNEKLSNEAKNPALNKGAVSRSAFLKLKFPNLPYCHFGLTRGSSSKWHESFHYRNASTKVQLNVFWEWYGSVTIGVYDPRRKGKRKNSTEYIVREINDEMIEKYCREFLS